MIGEKEIEVLLFMDNKKRSIGAKRNAMKSIANGKYFIFIDDDDSLYSVDELYEAAHSDVDVITFKVKCLNSDKSEFVVTYGLGNPIEHNTAHGRYLDCKRPPFSQCAWHEKFKYIDFPDKSYGEDWGFAEKANMNATTSRHIDKIIVGYNFDPKISEASL
jgi:glycosyltransferase involved in cell wall biosynthesis